MRHTAVIAACAMCFSLGFTLRGEVAQNRRPTFTADLVQGKEPAAAAAALLDGALQLADGGSWERIAVGRAWYLGGDKAKGQQIFDGVTSSRRVEGSDWFRIARVYAQAGEWTKARDAFDRAIKADPGDDSGMLEYGAIANVFKDRTKAEELFVQAFKKNPREFWHWVGAGGSYLGVVPQ